MAFPAQGWPPRPPSALHSIRVFITGTTTANWSDNAYLFINATGANTFTPTPYVPPGGTETQIQTPDGRNALSIGATADGTGPMGTGTNPNRSSSATVAPQIWSRTIVIYNDGMADLQFSFAAVDNSGATNNIVHGVVKAGQKNEYRERFECGIALRFPSGGSASAFRVEAW